MESQNQPSVFNAQPASPKGAVKYALRKLFFANNAIKYGVLISPNIEGCEQHNFWSDLGSEIYNSLEDAKRAIEEHKSLNLYPLKTELVLLED